MHRSLRSALALTVPALALTSLASCSPSLAQPFNSLGGATVTIYRLQNVEPPAQQAAGPSGFTLPPEVQSWIAGAASLLPPGLIPPGLIPGGTAAAPAKPQDLRFHDFRVISWQTVNDASQRSEILSILGHESNFTAPHSTCMYAEFGVAMQPAPGAPTDDVLISLSCAQVQGFNFAWPYAGKNGIPADTAKRIVAVAQKSFGGT
jgi:hypothetical protein